MTKFNINRKVTVTLTEAGAECYNDFTGATKEAGDVIADQLWWFMRIFGPKMRLGSWPLFENNEIEFDVT